MMRAAKLVASSIAALLDAGAHVARAGGLEHADAGVLQDCANRVEWAIEEAENTSAVERLGELAEEVKP